MSAPAPADVATSGPRAGASPRQVALGLARALRPRQWTKNVFVFAGLVFAERLFDAGAVWRSLAAFAVFCAVASAVYLVNDVVDRKLDLLHPVKRARPIASGQVPVPLALGVAAVLAAAGVAAAAALRTSLAVIVLVYLAISLAYSLWLKRAFIVDTLLVSTGFVLRAAAGAAVLAVEISPWLLACTYLLALFLSLGKRRHELRLLGEGATAHRSALGKYSIELVDSWLTALSGATIVCYALYTQSPRTVEHFGTTNLIYTVPFVIYGLFRYQHLAVREDLGGDPGSVVLRDRNIVIAVVLWALVAAVVIYR